ncbi:SDR family NAD(P)-dependent oxidoreductase [Ferrimonas marina]|uniref:Short-chain dehydrogenase n=1 Tax=Ferrimonas marina TaxID=299255 RepID=A0A1M5VRE7_9GAMM|nr:SDR family NAD(P)-dependent oxidoreductase [Ferrimonas marina]SHH77748.1 Short-chain dehydrogenase [Ferrimonas marina]
MPTVLITGASSGIGRQLAVVHAAQGWQVMACGRNSEALKQLAADSSGAIEPLVFDVTDASACQQALSECALPERVILNAGTCEYMSVEDWQTKPFDLVVGANLVGISNCLGPLLPRMSAGSTLALVDSLARLLPFTRAQAYGASKAAVYYLAQTLAVDLADRGIKVVSISPGFVRTPLTDRNEFAMPALMEVEDACDRIMDGLGAGRSHIVFPRRLAWSLKALSLLPQGMQIRICRWMGKQ